MGVCDLDAATGPIRAQVVDDLVIARGIPYGRADRFAAGVAMPPWRDVLDATARGPVCPQLPSRLDWVTGPVADGLDVDERHCLVLTVTAPRDAADAPVMVWFHGGAYMSGSGESPKYDAGELARSGGVVIVSVSYRLGVFGYLDLAGGPPNLGLLDQLLALRWVRDNIAAFGGDPGNVTGFGQSAGADAVYSLLLSEAADGLLHRAILQSAPLGLIDGRDDMTAAMRTAAAAALPRPPAQASVEEVLHAQSAAVGAASSFGLLAGFPFAPRLGSMPLPEPGAVDARIGVVAQRIDLLVGYARDDAAPFLMMAQDSAGPLPRDEVTRHTAEALTDTVFGAPARQLARTWGEHDGRSASYRLDWSPPDAPLGACHCIELPLLFDTAAWSDAPMLGPAAAPDIPRASGMLRSVWTAFAHRGAEALEGTELLFG